MYHFMFGLRGASVAPSAGASGCGSLAVLVVVWFLSSSCIIKVASLWTTFVLASGQRASSGPGNNETAPSPRAE